MSVGLFEAARKRVLVCDGAMGTELMKRGLEPGACPETWNIDHANEMLDVHKAYVDAGAELLLTNTFGGNRWKLDAYGFGDRVAELNAAAVHTARKAAGTAAFVVGDIGPTGRFVAPLGTDPPDAFVEIFAEQADALAQAGADAVILETFTALDETLAALEGARRTGLGVIASMSYLPAADGRYRTMMGIDVETAALALETAGALVVAANCGTGAQDYPGIAKALASATRLPVMVEPNAGMPQLVRGRTVFPMTPAEMASFIPPILAAGVRIVGGCCGTTPEHIREVRRIVDKAR